MVRPSVMRLACTVADVCEATGLDEAVRADRRRKTSYDDDWTSSAGDGAFDEAGAADFLGNDVILSDASSAQGLHLTEIVLIRGRYSTISHVVIIISLLTFDPRKLRKIKGDVAERHL